MKYAVLVEKVTGADEPDGLYYAAVPSLGLVTHGAGIESAMAAARDLVSLWLEELRESGEPVPEGGEALLGSIEVA